MPAKRKTPPTSTWVPSMAQNDDDDNVIIIPPQSASEEEEASQPPNKMRTSKKRKIEEKGTPFTSFPTKGEVKPLGQLMASRNVYDRTCKTGRNPKVAEKVLSMYNFWRDHPEQVGGKRLDINNRTNHEAYRQTLHVHRKGDNGAWEGTNFLVRLTCQTLLSFPQELYPKAAIAKRVCAHNYQYHSEPTPCRQDIEDADNMEKGEQLYGGFKKKCMPLPQSSEKGYYTYLLLDGREVHSFKDFLESLFYVGKTYQSFLATDESSKSDPHRPVSHFKHAANPNNMSSKSVRIRGFWDQGFVPGYLQFTANLGYMMEEDALYMESLMIATQGRGKLENYKEADCPTSTKKKSPSEKLLGKYLLYLAFLKCDNGKDELYHEQKHLRLRVKEYM